MYVGGSMMFIQYVNLRILFLACIQIKHYQKVKDLIHPNITDNIIIEKEIFIFYLHITAVA